MPGGSDELVELGRLNGAWGVAGWVKVFSHTDPPEAIFQYQPWLCGRERLPLEVIEWRQTGPRLLARFDGVDSREAADGLGRPVLYIRRSQLPAPGPDSHYWHDLIGLEVINREGHRFGRVTGLLDAGIHDVLVIVPEPGGREILVPFVPGRFVLAVRRAESEILVDWQPDWIDAD